MSINGHRRSGNLSGVRNPAGKSPPPGRIAAILALFLFLLAVIMPGAFASGGGALETGTSLTGDVALRQAYMIWLAARQEAGMNAVIYDIAQRNGSVERLTSVRESFHRNAANISSCNSMESLDSMLGTLQENTRQFRQAAQGVAVSGTMSGTGTEAPVTASGSGDGWSRPPEDEYWMTRMDAGPAALERYERESQETLSVLRGSGYDVAPAQEKLDQIEAMRKDYDAALAAHEFGAAGIIREKIQAAAVGFEDCIRNIRVLDEP